MKGEKAYKLKIIIMLAVLLSVIMVSFMLGRYPITPAELIKTVMYDLFGTGECIDANMSAIIYNVRLPRILIACMVGCALSASGASYQGVFQNAMASPDILGASSGAAFGASLAILNNASALMITISAFAFSLITVLLTLFVSERGRGRKVLLLVLTGMMVSSLFNAGTSFIKLVADPHTQLQEITYWLMGSLSGARKQDIMIAVIPMLIGIVPLYMIRWKINILTLGDDEAGTLGVDVKKLRVTIILCSTLLTAAAVSVSGMIGWVGLIIPHLCRRIVGNDYKKLIPSSMIVGAAFLLAVDDVSRNLLQTEIPIGILTAVIGAPFFLILITRRGDEL